MFPNERYILNVYKIKGISNKERYSLVPNSDYSQNYIKSNML